MKKKSFSWVEVLLRYWQSILGLGAVSVALIVFLATLAPRLSATEKKNAQQDEQISDLKGWAKEIQGYTRATQQMQQQVPNQPVPRPTWRYWTDEQGQCWRCDVRWDCERDENWEQCD